MKKILQIKCSTMNHELTLVKKNGKENHENKIQDIKCYRIYTIKEMEKGKKELVKGTGKVIIQLIMYLLVNYRNI